MCGITGYISEQIKKQELVEAVNSLKHRGPDNQSVWTAGNVGLGHARLSILDLSAGANQPMISHDGRFIVVYNGEVYNYRELAKKHQITTKTNSDTEVILELFAKLGPDFVNELNGMFAIAIFDKHNQRLFLFRDRIGIKPLYYFFDGENFAFASEIKALLKYNVVREGLKINKSTIASFLHLGYIPEPHTFFESIYKFPSGSSGVFEGNKFEIKPYWEIENKISETAVSDFTSAKKQLNDLLVSSVKMRLISDVPIGTFLSGGIDSSLVTAVAQSLSVKPVKTFSIGFKDSKFNEAEYAKEVAGYLKTEHHEFIVTEKDVLDLADRFFETYDEPFADSSGFPTMLVSELAKQYVTVALSGDGGDELFHGYGMYRWAKRLNSPLIKIFRKPLAAVLSMSSNRHKRVAGLFRYENGQSIKSHIFSQEQYFFSTAELKGLLAEEYSYRLQETFDVQRELTPAEAQSLFDLKNYLKDDLLVKVDRAGMQSALEIRVPLLDHRIVEFALNLHPQLKIRDKEQKYLLKQVLYDYVPEKFFARPKWGFSIPLEKWLRTDLKYLLDKYTSKEVIERFGVVNFEKVEKIKQSYLSGVDYLYNRLWLIIVLHKMLEKYFNEK